MINLIWPEARALIFYISQCENSLESLGRRTEKNCKNEITEEKNQETGTFELKFRTEISTSNLLLLFTAFVVGHLFLS